MAIQNTGATTASEKFSARLLIAAWATPAASSAPTSRPTIGDCRAAGDDAALFQRGSDIGDVLVQAGCAIKVLATTATPINPNGKRSSSRSTTNAIAPTMPRSRGSRRCQRLVASTASAVLRLSERSSAAIRRPSRSPDGRSRGTAPADNRRRARSSWPKGRARRTSSPTSMRTGRCCTVATWARHGVCSPMRQTFHRPVDRDQS